MGNPDFDRITVPLLSGANWGGFGLHSRGNFNGFVEAASSQKWLEVHTGDHIAPFYAAEGRTLLKEFYDHFLKDAAPIAQGWLRVSQRKLDLARSQPWAPYHTHDESQALSAGEIYEIDVEIWPGQVVLPAGSVIALRLEGKDFARRRSGVFGWLIDFVMDGILHLNVRRGSGFFLHNNPEDRPPNVFGGENTIHTGGARAAHLLVPVIPGS